MCTYSFQRLACPCVKGPSCAQKDLGQVLISGHPFHLLESYSVVPALGVACDLQRRLFGRLAPATLSCPRYRMERGRIISGSFLKSKLACVKCVQTCAPPSEKGFAPGPEKEGRGREEKAVGS